MVIDQAPMRTQTARAIGWSSAWRKLAWLAGAGAVIGFHPATLLAGQQEPAASADLVHAKVFDGDSLPSATVCGQCHPRHYREWSVSQHAYAQVSPVFNAMHGRILQLTGGTSGDFCLRCHTPVGTALGEPLFMSNADRHPISREGVTCIVCHRVNKAYGRVNARFAIAPGDVTAPIYGPTGDSTAIRGLIDQGRASDDASRPGRLIHGRAEKFFALTTSASCGMCHDVTLPSGLREIEAFSEYKSSPAAKRGVSCQDCHMGKEPGRYSGDPGTNYDWGPAARVGDQWTGPRKLTSHMIVGPDFSIVHPALFPLHPRAIRADEGSATGLATIRQWLEFDWRAGWGTDEFEAQIREEDEFPKTGTRKTGFPDRWAASDDRYDGREIIVDNLALLEVARQRRAALLRNGYALGDVAVRRADDREIRFAVEVRNATDGHSAPTSLDPERLVWLHVVVHDRQGRKVIESGDLDPNGDLRDLHSAYVRDGALPLDAQLFNLQSKFVTRNLRGGEREQVLPVNQSQSPLPFLRPARQATVLLGRSPNERKHKTNIEPLGHRWANYVVRGEHLLDAAPYTVTVELKAGLVPVNLINEIKGVGFDYQMTARQVADAVVAGHVALWTRQVVVDVASR